jgi:NADPH:quinone reductase-like Zn-dependent oxidoreductase
LYIGVAQRVMSGHTGYKRMSNPLNPKPDPGQLLIYQIRLKGHLDCQWTDWFGGLAVTLEDNGETLLTGPVIDQAALHGVLKKVRDLGMPLLSINRVKPSPANAETTMTAREKPNQNRIKGASMKAIVYTEYGSPDVLHLKQVEKPAPKDDEVLVKVHAASVNAADWHLLTADIFLVRLMAGLLKPKCTILGSDLAGQVEAVGKNVKRFQPGDAVFGDVFAHGFGSFAEYVTAPESALVLKPANLSFEEAAAAPLAAVTALQGLRDVGRIQPGQKVLINGASGGVGTFAVQIAKSFGAEVTAVCSTRNLEMACTLGADHVIDYTQEDFTHNGQHYDLILAANGYHPISAYQRALTPRGIYVMAGGTKAQLFQALLLGPQMSKREGKTLRTVTAKPNQKDLTLLKELLEAGNVVSVIDKRYSLSEVPEALRYLGAGHARGKVVITVEHPH